MNFGDYKNNASLKNNSLFSPQSTDYKADFQYQPTSFNFQDTNQYNTKQSTFVESKCNSLLFGKQNITTPITQPNTLFGIKNSTIKNGIYNSETNNQYQPSPPLFGTSQQIKQEDIKFNKLTQEINSLKELVNIMNKKLELLINKPQNEVIYVACNLHNHLLKETTNEELGNNYTTGFICDNCKYKQTKLNEKFYHCSSCMSNMGGNYDLCLNCVNNCLIRK